MKRTSTRKQTAMTALIDTAGRLHIDDELMEELVRIKAETHTVETLRRRRNDRTGRRALG